MIENNIWFNPNSEAMKNYKPETNAQYQERKFIEAIEHIARTAKKPLQEIEYNS